ncbi:Uncharacterized protein PBTT_08780 [Plasmodiophora brassicae]
MGLDDSNGMAHLAGADDASTDRPATAAPVDVKPSAAAAPRVNPNRQRMRTYMRNYRLNQKAKIEKLPSEERARQIEIQRAKVRERVRQHRARKKQQGLVRNQVPTLG